MASPTLPADGESHIRGLLTGTLTLLVSMLASIGLPMAFFVLWLSVLPAEPSGSPVYFPSSGMELLALLALFVASLPCIVVMLLFVLPLSFICGTLGVSGHIALPVAGVPIVVEPGVFLAAVVGLLVQTFIWWCIVAVAWSGASRMTTIESRGASSRGYTLWYFSRRRRTRQGVTRRQRRR